ncbi:MAG: trimethylamine methyltransferase family protein [Clostridia bacterium]|nr:trimethylamine methyltransferase family protein [Clostridia bacterium]
MKSLYVNSHYAVNQTVHASVLSDDQCREIVSSAIEVLERTGADVFDEKALKLFADNGCWVEGNRVRIPSGLTEWAINTAPSRVVLADRDGKRKLFLEGSNSYYGPGPTNTYFIDPFTSERRKPLKEDKVNVAKVCDALPNIDYVMDLGTASNVTANLADVHAFQAMLLNTTKPIVHWGFGIEQYEDIVNMCIAIAGSLEKLQQAPFIALYSESSPPGLHSSEGIGKAMWVAEKGLPLVYTPCVMAGATAPATMAGTLVQSLAESFIGLVASQLIRKGTPFILGGVIAIMDMKSTILSYGSAEFHLLQGAMANLGQYMKIPVFGTAGCTDAKTLDGQAAIESSLSIMMAASMGANLVHDVGYTEYGATGSLFQVVLGDEIIGYVKRIMRGIEVTDETLALDIIDNVGPGGHFLGEMHTMQNFKKETWFPTLIDRTRYDEWKMKGGLSMGDRIKAKTQDIINQHQPKQLCADVVEKINQIVAGAEAREAAKAKK